MACGKQEPWHLTSSSLLGHPGLVLVPQQHQLWQASLAAGLLWRARQVKSST